MPKKPGDRGKTNRRDAIKLARLMRSGTLTPVSVPAVEEDAMRDMCRARAEAIRDLKTTKFRLNACLLRHDIRDISRVTWVPAHRRWLSEGGCPTPAPPIVLPEYVWAVTEHTARLARLAQALSNQGQPGRLAPVVDALQPLRGVQLTGAAAPVAALGDLTWFAHPRQLMHSLGVTPSAYSTGERRR